MEPSVPNLAEAAYCVADEYRAGQLPHLHREQWSVAWRLLVDELKRRCPGHDDAEYEAALDRGFVDSR